MKRLPSLYLSLLFFLLTSCCTPQTSSSPELWSGINQIPSTLRITSYKGKKKVSTASAAVIETRKIGNKFLIKAVTARHCFSVNKDISTKMAKVDYLEVQQVISYTPAYILGPKIKVTRLDYGKPGIDLAYFVFESEYKSTPFKGVKFPVNGEKVYSIGFPMMSNTPNMSEGFYRGITGKEELSLPDGIENKNTTFLVAMEIIPGMSGGPIFTKDGYLVGVVSASIPIFSTYSLGTYIDSYKSNN